MTKCAYCDGRLKDEVHAAEGQLFCSRDCAILHKQELILAAANDAATEWYESCAEIVLATDIGIDEDASAECSWCEEEFDEDELKLTNVGLLCDRCIDAIRSRGEKVWVRS